MSLNNFLSSLGAFDYAKHDRAKRVRRAFGQKLAERRRERGLTNAEAATQANLPKWAISNCEQGHGISRRLVNLYAVFLGFTREDVKAALDAYD